MKSLISTVLTFAQLTISQVSFAQSTDINPSYKAGYLDGYTDGLKQGRGMCSGSHGYFCSIKQEAQIVDTTLGTTTPGFDKIKLNANGSGVSLDDGKTATLMDCQIKIKALRDQLPATQNIIATEGLLCDLEKVRCASN